METKKLNDNILMLSCDAEHILHRVGDKEYPELRNVSVAAYDVEKWEEVAVSDIPSATKEEYKKLVAELIHERYSADDETSLINNMLDGEPTEEHACEYREYQSYRAECKLRAKEILAERVADAEIETEVDKVEAEVEEVETETEVEAEVSEE